jgi:hypothetical protein
MLGVPLKKCGTHSWNYDKPVCYILITVYLAAVVRRSLQSGTERTCLIRTPVLTCNPIVVFDTAVYFPYNRPPFLARNACHATWVGSMAVHKYS